MKLKFIPLDYDSFDWKGENYVKIIGRDDQGRKVCIVDHFDVSFWAILKPDIPEEKIREVMEKINKIKIESSVRTTRVIKTELHNKKFLGKDIKAIKIFITNYKDAHEIAHKIDFEEIDKKREYDLNFITKYIIEKKIKPLHWYEIEGRRINDLWEFGGIAKLDVDLCLEVKGFREISHQKFQPRILAFDIETEDIELGKGKIFMISLVGKGLKKVLTWKKSSKKSYVESLKDEAEMIEKFLEYFKKYDPDILVGYFSDGFDLPYLRERAEKNRLKLSLGVDGSPPTFSRGALMTGKIKGVIHLDLLRFIKNVYSQYLRSETLSLDEVASELLGEKKVDFDAVESLNSGEPDWDKFFEYNLQDSLLTYKLMEKLWPDLFEITRIVQEPLFNVSRNTMASNVENYIIHNIERFNEIIEKRPSPDEIKKRRADERFEGAFVFQPKPGLYDNICFFDFSSMYASIIVTYNLSKSTFSEEKIPDAYEGYYKKKVYFSKEPGFFSELLKEIINKRRKFKEEYKKNPDPLLKARSNAFKLIANAAYGYQGFFGARYYCIEAAASTAYFARNHIKEAIKKFEERGFKVIYSDTDSICIELKDKTKEDALAVLKEINANLPGVMELDFEGYYKRGIWVTKRTGEIGAKKKYALIDEKGKIKIRGFETVRRDWCNLAREVQNKVLELILKNGNEKKALEYVKEVIKKLKKREIPLKKLIIKTQLKKSIDEYKAISPHVTIAKKMKEKGLPVNIGMLIEYYIADTKNKKALVRERAKLPTEEGDYDVEYYLKNQILPSVENIFEVFNINFKEIIEGKKQMSLGEF